VEQAEALPRSGPHSHAVLTSCHRDPIWWLQVDLVLQPASGGATRVGSTSTCDAPTAALLAPAGGPGAAAGGVPRGSRSHPHAMHQQLRSWRLQVDLVLQQAEVPRGSGL